MSAPATAARADTHRDATADHSRLGQLILILKLDLLLKDLPTTLAPIRQRRVKLLINLHRRLTMTMPPVLGPSASTQPAWILRTITARERRRLTLARSPRLLQLALKPRSPRLQLLVLPRHTNRFLPQLLVLSPQCRAPRRQARALIHRLDRKDLHL
jgi:hypothetical protein